MMKNPKAPRRLAGLLATLTAASVLTCAAGASELRARPSALMVSSAALAAG